MVEWVVLGLEALPDLLSMHPAAVALPWDCCGDTCLLCQLGYVFGKLFSKGVVVVEKERKFDGLSNDVYFEIRRRRRSRQRTTWLHFWDRVFSFNPLSTVHHCGCYFISSSLEVKSTLIHHSFHTTLLSCIHPPWRTARLDVLDFTRL